MGATARALPAALGIGDKDKARERLTQAGMKVDDRQKQQVNTVFGNYNPVTSMKEAAGVALEGVSTLYGGGALLKLVSRVLLNQQLKLELKLA